jgi:membrane-associated phospholipid phosphatase
MARGAVALLAVCSVAVASHAAAQPTGGFDLSPPARPRSSLVPSYLWDDGALVFVWGALAAREGVDRWVSPPSSPVGFSAEEGGRQAASWELPGYVVTASGGVLGAAMLLGRAPARWDHLKGLAQTLSTGALLTIGLKVAFGRRRPDQGADPDAGFGGGSRSFPSGHATQAFEIATYAALLVRQRAAGGGAAWRWSAYAGLYGAAALVAAERVVHDRHHVTDVLAGAALGTATAAVFFVAAERRATRRAARRATRSFLLTPALGQRELGLQAQWRY